MKTFILKTDQDCRDLYGYLKAEWFFRARESKPLVVSVEPEGKTRSAKQNRRLHALLLQIEEQSWVEGRQYSAEVWKEHLKRSILGTYDLPGGGIAALSTSGLTVSEFHEFCNRAEAYASTELGVQFEPR